jgi:hypothetical protein
MGASVSNFAKEAAKTAAKAAISHAGTFIPIVGGPLASFINSKFARGSFAVGTMDVDVPEGAKKKMINTPSQLKSLVKQYPDEAKKAGLTVEMIDSEVKEAKTQAKAVGGMVKMKDFGPALHPAGDRAYRKGNMTDPVVQGPVKKGMAIGGAVAKEMDEPKPKAKRTRTAAQLAATAKLVKANRERRK